MKRVIKHGNVKRGIYRTACTNCGCVFEHTVDEWETTKFLLGSVSCPECEEDNDCSSRLFGNAEYLTEIYKPK